MYRKQREQRPEAVRSEEHLDAVREDNAPEEGPLDKAKYSRVKFTGQQPGEEGVERDEEPGEDDDKDEEPEDKREVDEDGERVVPIKDPTHKIPRV
jgi:hypothetical protein